MPVIPAIAKAMERVLQVLISEVTHAQNLSLYLPPNTDIRGWQGGTREGCRLPACPRTHTHIHKHIQIHTHAHTKSLYPAFTQRTSFRWRQGCSRKHRRLPARPGRHRPPHGRPAAAPGGRHQGTARRGGAGGGLDAIALVGRYLKPLAQRTFSRPAPLYPRTPKSLTTALSIEPLLQARHGLYKVPQTSLIPFIALISDSYPHPEDLPLPLPVHPGAHHRPLLHRVRPPLSHAKHNPDRGLQPFPHPPHLTPPPRSPRPSPPPSHTSSPSCPPTSKTWPS